MIASRVIGEVFITLGVLMLLFVTYQLWWTNVLADQEAGGAAQTCRTQWDGRAKGADATRARSRPARASRSSTSRSWT